MQRGHAHCHDSAFAFGEGAPPAGSCPVELPRSQDKFITVRNWKVVKEGEVDSLGRATKVTYPNSRVDYIVYKDSVHEVRTYPAWDATNNVPLLPITVTST